MSMWVIKELTHFLAPIVSSVNSLNYFHLLPKLFLNFIRPQFRRNLDGLCITSSSMWEIVGNPCQLWVMLGQPWLACLWEWAIHGCCPGHHATGLLLETWTLGNAGMNSRSLCDCSTCSFSFRNTTTANRGWDCETQSGLLCKLNLMLQQILLIFKHKIKNQSSSAYVSEILGKVGLRGCKWNIISQLFKSVCIKMLKQFKDFEGFVFFCLSFALWL